MAIQIEDKLVYLFNPRTGSSATAEALEKLPGAIRHPDHHATRDKIKIGKAIVVTTVRNHWDTVASWWLLSGRVRPIEMLIDGWHHSHFVRNKKLFWQDSDKIIFYEFLEPQLNALLQSLDLPTVELSIINPTVDKCKQWIKHYSYDAYYRVADYFHDEILELGYQIHKYRDLVNEAIED